MLFVLGVTTAQASPVSDCIRAYVDVSAFRDRSLAPSAGILESVPAAERLGLAYGLAGFDKLDFRDRGRKLQARYPDELAGLIEVYSDAIYGADMRVQPLLRETASARADAVAGKPIFALQEKLLSTVHGCDVTHGFTPVVNPAPATQAAERFRRSDSMDRQRDAARAAGLSDVQCAVRFAVAAQSQPAGPARDFMAERYQTVLKKLQDATPAAALPQVQTELQREAQEVSQSIQSQRMTAAMMIADVNGCEARLGMPVTRFGP